MEFTEQTVSSRQLFQGRVFRVELDEITLPNGKPAQREVIRHNGGVGVLAIDGEGQVLLVRQFRYPYGQVLLEIPAGKLEVGEDPAACGLRELEEETGYIAGDYRFLARVYPSPGYVDEVLHLYLAQDLTSTQQNLDEDEFLAVERMPLADAIALCMDSTITDAKTLVALLKYKAVLDSGGLDALPKQAL